MRTRQSYMFMHQRTELQNARNKTSKLQGESATSAIRIIVKTSQQEIRMAVEDSKVGFN